MSDSILIRDFFNPRITKQVAKEIKARYSNFDRKGFETFILTCQAEQTYSERKSTFIQALLNFLPDDFKKSIDLLISILPQEYEGDSIEGGINRFYLTAFTGYISQAGINDFDLSMQALYKITKRFTAEWDVRPFIQKYPEKAFRLLKEWSKDANPHVRRLVSEGSRPNLPWGRKLRMVAENPRTTSLPLLSALYNDESEYVRRSVANHLNDLAKYDADLVVTTLSLWQKEGSSNELDKLTNHALRTLIKQGHSGSLALIGYDDDFDIDLTFDSITEKVNWGETFYFDFTLKNNRTEPKDILIDFIIGFQKKDGSIVDKVFKLKKITLDGKEAIQMSKKQSFRPITTRVYYPGTHDVSIQVNGKLIGSKQFVLLPQLEI